MVRLMPIVAALTLLALCSSLAAAAPAMSNADLVRMTDSYLNVQDIAGLVEFADALHSLCDYESLLVVVQRAYEKLPADQPQIRAHALRGIAESYEGLGKLDQAIATYRETIQKFPDSPQTPWAHIGIARSLIGLGRYDEARAELRGVLRKWPGTTAAAWAEEQTGYSYLDQQKPRQALDYIKRALHNYPPEKHPREMGFPSLKYLRVEIALPHLNEAYVQLGDDAAALAEFGTLRAAADVGPTALYYTAVHHQRLGHYDQAIDLFAQYLALPEQFFRLPDAHFNRAMSYFAKGDYDRAIAGWREVATKFPLHYLAEESALWIRIAEGRKAGK